MDESDSTAARSHPGHFIDQPVSPGAALGQRLVEIGDAVADMMDPRSAPLEKFGDGAFGRARFQQLDLGGAQGKRDDVRAIGSFRRMRRDAEHVAIEWQRGFDALDRDTDMGDNCA